MPECFCFALPKCLACFKPDIFNGKYTCLNKLIVWEKIRRNEKLLCKPTENMSSNNCPHLRLTLCFPISNEMEPRNFGDFRLWLYAYSQCTQLIHLCFKGNRNLQLSLQTCSGCCGLSLPGRWRQITLLKSMCSGAMLYIK